MPAQCVYVFRMKLTAIVCNFSKQRQQDGLGDRELVCFPWGVKCIFHNNYWLGRLKEVERGGMWRHGTEDMEKPEDERHHRKSTHKLGDDIKIDLRNNDIIP